MRSPSSVRENVEEHIEQEFPPPPAVMFALCARQVPLKGEWDPQAPGAEFRAGLMLPKSVNFDAVSDNRIIAFRIKTPGVGTIEKGGMLSNGNTVRDCSSASRGMLSWGLEQGDTERSILC